MEPQKQISALNVAIAVLEARLHLCPPEDESYASLQRQIAALKARRAELKGRAH